MQITIEKTFQGALRLSTIIDDEYYTKQYFYYTVKEAKEDFIDHIKREKIENFISQNTIINEVQS